MDKIKIAVADDEPLIREGLQVILSTDPEIEIAGLCKNGEEAMQLVKSTEVDVILMDIRMPGCDGVLGTKLVKDNSPATKVLVLTTFNDDEYIFDAMKYGASGYLLKDTSHDVILNAIKSVYKGNVILHPDVAARIVSNKSSTGSDDAEDTDNIKIRYSLTSREIDIIKGVSSGLSNKEIGDQLYLTEGTVKNHITEILSKLSLRDRTQIAIFAFRNNIQS